MVSVPNRLFVVMGVSGCGKSSIGETLANQLNGAYFEGDDLHPPNNIALMSAGTPLTDKDRWPWLDSIANEMSQMDGLVFVGCSALKKSYRSFLIEQVQEPVFFIHLSGSKELIADRMRRREGHFMPTGLLDSQFAALEPPTEDEASIRVNISATQDQIVQEVVAALQEKHNIFATEPDTLSTQ